MYLKEKYDIGKSEILEVEIFKSGCKLFLFKKFHTIHFGHTLPLLKLFFPEPHPIVSFMFLLSLTQYKNKYLKTHRERQQNDVLYWATIPVYEFFSGM